MPDPRPPRDDAWDWSEWGPPQPVEGGLTATTGGRERGRGASVAPGAVGTTVVRQVVGRVSPGVASRGRSYARAGQTMALEIARGEVRGRVQGALDEPYAVQLRCDVPGRAAKVLPALLRRVLDDPEAGIPLHAPRAVLDAIAAADLLRGGVVTANCSCPYGAVCKHCVAVAYVAAERLDQSPAAIAEFVGVPLASLGPRPAGPSAAAASPPVFSPSRQARLARNLARLRDRPNPSRDEVIDAALRLLPAPDPVLDLLDRDR